VEGERGEEPCKSIWTWVGWSGVSKWRSDHLRLGRCTGERMYKY
jgi:hypothetical protein